IGVDVRVAAADAVLPSRAIAEAKGIALELCIKDDARLVVADPTALRQVLTNLVENAVRHTSAGSVTVMTRREDEFAAAASQSPSVRDGPAPAGEPGVWITVRDTGVGIGPEHLPRIFERFYRVDRARTRDAGGTGLGLAIVRHVADNHHGKVSVQSREGEGSRFTLSIPAAPGDGDEPAGE